MTFSPFTQNHGTSIVLWNPSATEDSIWANLGREGSKGYFFLCGSKQPEKDKRVEKLPSHYASDGICLNFHISFWYIYNFLCLLFLSFERFYLSPLWMSKIISPRTVRQTHPNFGSFGTSSHAPLTTLQDVFAALIKIFETKGGEKCPVACCGDDEMPGRLCASSLPLYISTAIKWHVNACAHTVIPKINGIFFRNTLKRELLRIVPFPCFFLSSTLHS